MTTKKDRNVWYDGHSKQVGYEDDGQEELDRYYERLSRSDVLLTVAVVLVVLSLASWCVLSLL